MLSGECKTAGGKLVAVDLEIQDSRIATPRIRGDFFVEPEVDCKQVLRGIESAIAGMPIDLDLHALTAHIRAAIPLTAELLGTSPEAIAVAVRRAIDGDPLLHNTPILERIGSFSREQIQRLTEPWTRLAWNLIPEIPRSAALNVALDEVLTENVARGLRNPTLRFWRWQEPAVIIGRTQSVINEVDVRAAAASSVRIVRRITGGGAMFLQPHGAITYSIYVPATTLSGLSIRQSYEVCDAWVIEALRELQVDAHHVPINDIACSEGKIGGAAQARRSGIILHHTTIAYDMNPGEMLQVLRIGREKLKDKATPSAAKRVSPLVRQTGLSRDAIVTHLLRSFHSRFGGTMDEVTSDELEHAQQLVTEKYAHPSWTHEFE